MRIIKEEEMETAEEEENPVNLTIGEDQDHALIITPDQGL